MDGNKRYQLLAVLFEDESAVVLKALCGIGFFRGVHNDTNRFLEGVKKLIDKDSDTMLATLGVCKMISPKRINAYIEYAEKVNAPKSMAFLLSWKNKNVDLIEEHRQAEEEIERQLNIEPKEITPEDPLEEQFHFISKNGRTMTIKYRGTDSKVEIPSEYRGKVVNEVRKNAFEGKDFVTEIILPESITIIEEKAFKDCMGLKKIVLPKFLWVIGMRAFENSGLVEITLPGSIRKCRTGAFRGCKALTDVTLPVHLMTIEKSLFSDCTSLRSITIPDGMTTIAANGFLHCSSLEKIVIPASVETIWHSAFDGCEKLVIYAPIGSRAQSYAIENKIKFEAI